jgi:hypothetical protein
MMPKIKQKIQREWLDIPGNNGEYGELGWQS